MPRDNSSDTDAAFELGLHHHQGGRLAQAEVLYRRVIQADPEHPGARYLLAGIFYQGGKYQDAFELVNSVAVEVSDDAGAQLLLGLCAQRLGHSDLAIDSINHALALKPDFAEAHGSLGDVLLDRGEFERAISSYNQALALNPSLFETHLRVASVQARQGKLDEALVSLQKALALNPNNCDAHSHLGALLTRQDKPDEAFASFQKALALNPNHSDAHCNLGALLTRQDKPDEAFASFQKALALNPNNSDAHNNLGALLMRQDRPDAAFASFQKALALSPNHIDARGNLGRLLQTQGRFDEAIACHREALSIRPDDFGAYADLASAFHYKGELAEAANCCRRAIELGTTNPVTHHKLAALTGADAGPIPRVTVTSMFDDWASRFDAHLLDVLGYSAPRLMREAVDRLTHGGRRFQHALDLGCGTGLVGAHFRDIVGEIDGVDLSARMLEHARRTEIYRKLDLEEMVAWLERAAMEPLSYDIVLSADVFIYVGNLELVFRAVQAILAGGGLFVFSVEHQAQGSFELLPTGRFAHSASYVRELASKYGFTIELCQQVDLRKERDDVIVGTIFVLKRQERVVPEPRMAGAASR
jgi:predicted TPR repeat methyltransferase